MKRFIITMLLSVVATSAFAQNWQELFCYDLTSGEYRTYYKIDRDAMYFSFEADGDQNNPIKNYKKNGNTETFDVYLDYNPSELVAKVVLTLVPEMADTKIKTTEELAKQQIKVTQQPGGNVSEYGIKLKSQGGNYPFHGEPEPGPSQAERIKDGAAKLLGKSKEMIQNQKEKKEAKKKEKAEAEAAEATKE